jgi:histidinol-phosphate aminotransferase
MIEAIMHVPEPRENIKTFAPYVPGMSIDEVKKKYNLEDIVKLASNENLWGTSAQALKKIEEELGNLHLYPNSEPAELKKCIADRNSLPMEMIIAGNGTDELIELIAKTFLKKEDNIVISKNSFVRYKMAGVLMEAQAIEIEQDNLKIDLSKIYKQINSKTKIIYIDNPCNPTGTYIPREEVDSFLEKVSSMDKPPLIVFDEAYFEYVTDSSYCSALEYIDKDIPLMVLRTFSKIYGLAGLRVGYGIAKSEIISYINRIRPPFNVNRLAQAAAVGSYQDTDFIKRVAAEVKEEKEYLYKELERIGLEYVPSQTNFILVHMGSGTVSSLCEYLLKNGIILRPLAGYSLDEYIRITVGKREHNIKLIKALENFLNEKAGK